MNRHIIERKVYITGAHMIKHITTLKSIKKKVSTSYRRRDATRLASNNCVKIVTFIFFYFFFIHLVAKMFVHSVLHNFLYIFLYKIGDEKKKKQTQSERNARAYLFAFGLIALSWRRRRRGHELRTRARTPRSQRHRHMDNLVSILFRKGN